MADADSAVIEVSDDSFAHETGTGWVLVDFYASWCSHCKAFRPQYERAAEAHKGPVRFLAADVDEANAAAGRFKVRSIPTIVLLRDGEKQDFHTGEMSSEQVAQWLDERVKE